MDNIQGIDFVLASKMKPAYLCKLIFYLHTHTYIYSQVVFQKKKKISQIPQRPFMRTHASSTYSFEVFVDEEECIELVDKF